MVGLRPLPPLGSWLSSASGTSAFSAHLSSSSEFLVPKARCAGAGHALLLLALSDPSPVAGGSAPSPKHEYLLPCRCPGMPETNAGLEGTTLDLQETWVLPEVGYSKGTGDPCAHLG